MWYLIPLNKTIFGVEFCGMSQYTVYSALFIANLQYTFYPRLSIMLNAHSSYTLVFVQMRPVAVYQYWV